MHEVIVMLAKANGWGDKIVVVNKVPISQTSIQYPQACQGGVYPPHVMHNACIMRGGYTPLAVVAFKPRRLAPGKRFQTR